MKKSTKAKIKNSILIIVLIFVLCTFFYTGLHFRVYKDLVSLIIFIICSVYFGLFAYANKDF